MKQISSRDFQKSYAKLTEAFEVTSWDDPIGVWIPRESPLYDSLPVGAFENAMTPASAPVRRTLPTGQRVVRNEVRVIDAVTISRQQGASREAWRNIPAKPRR